MHKNYNSLLYSFFFLLLIILIKKKKYNNKQFIKFLYKKNKIYIEAKNKNALLKFTYEIRKRKR